MAGYMMYTKEYTSSDIEKIKKYAGKYSKSTGVYICCLSDSRELLFDYECSHEDRQILSTYVNEDMIRDLYSRVAIEKLEDQVIEDTAAGDIKVAATAIRAANRCRYVFIVCAGVSDDMHSISGLSRCTSFAGFLNAVDVLREIADEFMRMRMSEYHYEEENRQSREYARELTTSLSKSNALTDILKLLNDDKNFETIAARFLAITAGYLNTSHAMVVRTLDKDSMDVLCQWSDNSTHPIYDRNHIQKRLPFIEGNKPVILSGDLLTGKLDIEEWDILGVKAVIAMPVYGDDMYCVYVETVLTRSWHIDELQFLADASRILQSSIERKIQKNSLASSYASLEEILEHVGCAIIVLDNNNGVVHFENRIMKKLFSKEKINPELDRILWDRHESGKEIEFYDYTTGLNYEIHHNVISWVNGKKVCLFAIYDVTDKKNYQKRIEQQAYTDFLTGLFNRLCCERDLARVIDESKKSNKCGALLYMDLDDFKHINDALGHQYGDVLLKDISQGISSIKGLEDHCYRMGGDEFVMIVHPRAYDELDRIISDIKDVFLSPFILKDGEYYCTMSMGIVVFPEEGDKVGELIQKADVAMYEAKKSGKNRVAKYVTGSTSDANKRLDMEKNMRDATSDSIEEFLVYYQPIIDIQKEGNPCVGAEALVRWESKEMGFISPGDFIPLAEYLGLINPIGEHVLLEACRTLKFWNDNGHPEYKVNVNLSVVQLMQNDIVESIEKVVKKTGINPHNLTLEVTESLAINDMNRMKGIMTSIREMGIRIALDDFGTGYSSLNHIREIPLDVIKVDQSFVKELAQDDYSQSFIRMVAELASAIDVDICVEGIETKQQYEVLENMKVRLVQGFYFDRPMTHDDFMAKYM